tara:strand:- start:3814 stop:4293 length:480 start_codon:yes stop_codon:yes gene_type:complete
MPERVTREERMVSLAIEKARKAKQELSAKKRMNIEPTQVNEFDSEVEVQKIKRPKVQDASKITNQTQEKEGYGLAGESLKKSEIKKFEIDKINDLIGKKGSLDELTRMVEKYGKTSGGSSSSYYPSVMIDGALNIEMESLDGSSEKYTIKNIQFFPKSN